MSRSIDDLHPDLQQPCKDFLDICKNNDLNPFIIFTWRSPKEQNDLYAQGRTRPGKRVTNLTGDKSLHCFSIDGEPASKAFDFGLYDENNNYIKDGGDKLYAQAGAIGEDLGLEWGGDWKGWKDYDHFQLRE